MGTWGPGLFEDDLAEDPQAGRTSACDRRGREYILYLDALR